MKNRTFALLAIFAIAIWVVLISSLPEKVYNWFNALFTVVSSISIMPF